MVSNWKFVISFCTLLMIIGWSFIATGYVVPGGLVVISSFCIFAYYADKESVHN